MRKRARDVIVYVFLLMTAVSYQRAQPVLDLPGEAPALEVLSAARAVQLPPLDRPASHARPTVHVLSLGDGQATLVRCGRSAALIGSGPPWGATAVIDYLQAEGIPALDAVIAASDWERHAGGLPALLRQVRARVFYDAVPAADGASYVRVLETVRAVGLSYERVRAGQRFKIGCFDVQVLAPDDHAAVETDVPSPLARSGGVFLLQAGSQNVLYADNVDKDVENALVRIHPDLRIDALIVARGGHKDATSRLFIEHFRPRVAVIPVGSYNEEGRPHPEVLERLARVGAHVFRTDRHGTVVLALSPDGVRVQVRPPLSPVDAAGAAPR